MKNTYFLKKTHVNTFAYVLTTYLIAVALYAIIAFSNHKTIFVVAILFALSTVFSLWSIRFYKTTGLYINDEKLCYKGTKTEEIDINTVKGIKILKAYSSSKYRSFYPLKNGKGGFLYTAILLKEITDEMKAFEKGDLWFNSEFKNYIICSVTYDKEAVDYLKKLNPNVEII